MSINIDPNAAHAVYAPSSAYRWTVCTASAEAIANLPEQEEGEEAAEGTAAHEEIERCLKAIGHGDIVGGGDFIALTEPVDIDHPAAWGIALLLNYAQQLATHHPGKFWIEQRVALTPQIWGRCDVAHWDDANSTLTIVDYKNGFVGVDAEENDQLRIYGMASIYTHNLPAKWLRYAVVQPRDFRPVPRVKQWIEPVDHLHAWAERVATIPQKPKQFVAGEACTYCPLFGRCDASRDILTNVGALVAGLMQAEDVTPAQRALFRACEKPITDAFKKADKVWLKDELAGKNSPGLGVFTSVKHRAWENPEAARKLIVERLGADALDVPTPAQAIERGIPEDIVSTMAPRPEGSPVLGFAGDKRKPFARKSASEMFKDVPGVTG